MSLLCWMKRWRRAVASLDGSPLIRPAQGWQVHVRVPIRENSKLEGSGLHRPRFQPDIG